MLPDAIWGTFESLEQQRDEVTPCHKIPTRLEEMLYAGRPWTVRANHREKSPHCHRQQTQRLKKNKMLNTRTTDDNMQKTVAKKSLSL